METVSVCEGENILKMNGCNDCTTMCMYLMLLNYICKKWLKWCFMYNLTQLLKNEILVYIAVWLNLDSIMQPEITDTNEQILYNSVHTRYLEQGNL